MGLLSQEHIHLNTLQIARTDKMANFKGTVSWCDRFMKRKNLTLHLKTKIAQKLPQDYEERITSFKGFMIRLRKEKRFELNQIGNMDELFCSTCHMHKLLIKWKIQLYL